jgi:hypothetical protein
VRRLIDGHNKFVYRADCLEYGHDGVIELKDRLEDEERDADGTKEGVARLRDQYNAKLQKLEECEGVLSRLEAPIQDLRIKHADHNNRLYDFIDVAPGDAKTEMLPGRVLDRIPPMLWSIHKMQGFRARHARS